MCRISARRSRVIAHNWIARRILGMLVLLGFAVAFGGCLQATPNTKSYRSFFNEGKVFQKQGELDKAIASYSEVIRLNPDFHDVYCARSSAYIAQENYRVALIDAASAIRTNPECAIAYCNRAKCYEMTRRYRFAVNDYETALRMEPKCGLAHNNLAWLLAACPDEKYRDGAGSVRHAKSAFDSMARKTWISYGVMAAAHAEHGQFDLAVEYGEQSLDLAPEKGREGARNRLELYRQGKPYRRSLDGSTNETQPVPETPNGEE